MQLGPVWRMRAAAVVVTGVVAATVGIAGCHHFANLGAIAPHASQASSAQRASQASSGSPMVAVTASGPADRATPAVGSSSSSASARSPVPSASQSSGGSAVRPSSGGPGSSTAASNGGGQPTDCSPAAGSTMTNTVSHICGFPDTTNSGVPDGVALRSVPGQVSKGPGWTSSPDGSVDVTGNGAVLSGLSIHGTLDVEASNVTIKDVQVTASDAFAVDFRHTSNDTIENSTISGVDAGSGRVDAAIADVYGDSTGLTVKDDNIYWFRCAVQLTSGTITGNYIHDPGYISGDHTNGVISNEGAPLTVSGNTIFNSQGQTDCITIDDSQDIGVVISNRTITGNLLAGGGYPIYAGTHFGNTTSNIVVTDNRFSRIFFPAGGQYGTDADYNEKDPGNVWTGNVWDGTGKIASS